MLSTKRRLGRGWMKAIKWGDSLSEKAEGTGWTKSCFITESWRRRESTLRYSQEKQSRFCNIVDHLTWILCKVQGLSKSWPGKGFIGHLTWLHFLHLLFFVLMLPPCLLLPPKQVTFPPPNTPWPAGCFSSWSLDLHIFCPSSFLSVWLSPCHGEACHLQCDRNCSCVLLPFPPRFMLRIMIGNNNKISKRGQTIKRGGPSSRFNCTVEMSYREVDYFTTPPNLAWSSHVFFSPGHLVIILHTAICGTFPFLDFNPKRGKMQ